METKIKWYDKKWVVTLLCIFFFPLGLVGLWKSNVIKQGWKIAITIIIGLVVLANIGKDDAKTSTKVVKQNDYSTEDLSTYAFLASQEFVTHTLKSPSTAKFHMFDFRFNKLDSYTYQISSYVDSQNGFGAMIRTNFITKVRFTGGEPANYNSWQLEDIHFSDHCS